MSKIDPTLFDKMLKEGKTPKELAEHFNVSISAISKHKKKLSIKSGIIDHAHKVNEPLKKEKIDEIIQIHKAAAEQARKIFDENTSLESKIRKGLERLAKEVSKATTAIQITNGNIIGTWCDWLIFGKSESKDRISKWEAGIDTFQRFLQRAPEIKQELERQLVESRIAVRDAKAVKNKLAKLYEYQDRKNELRKTYSDGKFFDLGHLAHEINSYEPELFTTDFLAFFVELQAKNHSKSRVLAIPVPENSEDALAVERFWKWWRYEFLRYDLLSRAWNRDVQRGAGLVREMRTIANVLSLVKDFGDVFLPQLQAQNKGFRILELR